ncbi:hypothetical protein [Spirulina sp. 06S082]|uniref:hypothetical protein n=1 Tax=Spirulina sp. 06S082 TaxID=3110248 RepID=UPI002B1F2017|nr:hypothetical protein [Spirulina sp. 06S082]MEA5468231.1 hypothetical protein [Spirulina sp. 06S082]
MGLDKSDISIDYLIAIALEETVLAPFTLESKQALQTWSDRLASLFTNTSPTPILPSRV